jgi:glucokinase
MLLAGDIGGTKTLLGLFDPSARRPAPRVVREFLTQEYGRLESIVEAFLDAEGVRAREISAASLGVAGAITDQVAQLTNVPWLVDARGVAERMGFERVHLLNDLEALAHAVPVLDPDELAVLQDGTRVASGNAAVIAAGTGLGEALLLNIGGRLVPGESEGGHADFAARTPRELGLVAALARIFGRVSVEHVLSGPGLVNVYQFTHGSFGDEPFLTAAGSMPARLCAGVGGVQDLTALPARITASAAAGRCRACAEALEMFVAAYGAEAGNLALRTVATAGLFVGGGIAPRILPALQAGGFMDAFRDKAPMDGLVARIPVAVILNRQSGLLGAAVHAQGCV